MDFIHILMKINIKLLGAISRDSKKKSREIFFVFAKSRIIILFFLLKLKIFNFIIFSNS